METRLVELSRLESQLWPFSSRVDDASAIPARSIHSASVFAWPSLNGRVCECFFIGWWKGSATFLYRFESGTERVELLLRGRVRELLREERMGGVLGTEMLEMYEVLRPSSSSGLK